MEYIEYNSNLKCYKKHIDSETNNMIIYIGQSMNGVI